VPSGDEKLHDIVEAIFGSQMERGIGLVSDVGAGKGAGVCADDAADEGQIVEENRASEADRDVNPGSRG